MDAERFQVSTTPRLVTIRVAMDAPPSTVWHALVDPELGPKWAGGYRFVTAWEVGGAFTVSGTLNGKPYVEPGALIALEPGKSFTYDHWSRLWRVPDTPANHAVLTLTVEPRGPHTTVAMRHELPVVEALAEHSAFFWSVALDQLRRLVEPS